MFLHHIGIINGKSETEFAPNDNLSREDLGKCMKEIAGQILEEL